MVRGKYTEYEIYIRRKIADNIRRLLDQHKMTQKKLSEVTGIPTSTLSDYLNEKSLAVPGNVQKIANAFGVRKEDVDPSFGSDDINVEDPRMRFFRELEEELGVDLSDPDAQVMLKRAAKIVFGKED